MKERYIKLIIMVGIFAVVLGVYLHLSAPTASFWDCGELIACSYILGVPHPPGTPLFVLIGRIFTMFPIAREIAMRTNFLTAFFGAISCALLYLIIFKLISLQKSTQSFRQKFPFLPHIASIAGAFALAFAYSYWDNCVETEVYTPCVVAALLVIYLALTWRDKVERGIGDNRIVLFAIFLLFLSAGIHFTSMMVLFPLLVFAFMVDRKSILQLHIFELIILFLVIVLVAGYDLIGYFVLFLASPPVALLQILLTKGFLFVIFVLIYGGYLYYLHTKKKLDKTYVFWGLVLIFLAGTVQLYLLVRSRLNPAIDEVNPANWKDFVSVLMREQYDPMKLLPRKTQFLTENDYRNYPNSYPAFSLFVGYFEQLKYYLRYFLWQWAGEKNLDIYLRIRWQALIGIIPVILGFWGIFDHFKRDRKSWWLIVLCFFIASIGLLTYLNPKYSPSDPRQQLQYREVRERDYFYAFSYVFFAIFIGLGINAFLNWIIPRLKFRKIYVQAVSACCIILLLIPIAFNYGSVTRRGDWIPAEYGYNMIFSVGEGKAIMFTNGDNDTFPLWFVQNVPNRPANYDPMFGKNVAVANLSLLNTNWYVRQLKEWGAPISFSLTERVDGKPIIDELPQGFMGKNRRTFLLKDIMIRDIIATNAGVKLRWPEDYASTAEEFMTKVMDNYNEGQMSVFFATTVDRGENLKDVEPYLKLEGLVNRVTNNKNLGQVDVARTQYLLDNYKMVSMLDPKVSKDDNTKGLFMNYIASYAALSQEYQKAGQLDLAITTLAKTLSFEIDPQRKVPIYYNLSMFSLMKQDFAGSIAYLDSVDKLGYKDPELTLRRGWIYQQQGNYQAAEQVYQQAQIQNPNKPEPVQSLVSLYTDYMFDTAKAKTVLQDWLRKNPNDATAKSMLQGLEPKPKK